MLETTEKNRRGGCVRIAFLLAAVLLVMSIVEAYAQSDLQIEISLNRPKIAVGEQAKLTVTVSGPSGFSEPVVTAPDGLEIVLQGRTQSVQIVNMEVKSSKIFLYAVIPYKEGEFTIGPVRVERQGNTYQSPTANLSVEKRAPPRTKTEGPENVVVEASVDNVNPYIGQQMILLFRFARRASVRIRNVGYQLPPLSDFWKEEMTGKREYDKNINGFDYHVTEIAVPLFPINERDITIEGITFNYEEEIPSQRSGRDSPFSRNPFAPDFFDDDFFNLFNTARAHRRVAHTAPIEIHVRPLPQKDKPKGFRGGVGNFKLSANLSNDEVKVGESVTLTLNLSGVGNIRDVVDPEINIGGVKTYFDTPTIEVGSRDNSVVGKRVYKFALVPQQAGDVEIPWISMPYFNPESERYELASSAPLTLKVFPSEEESLVVTKAPVAKEKRERISPPARDILPIHERLDSIEISGFEVWLRRARPVVYPLPVIFYAVCFILIRRKERLQTDTAYRRQRMASKVAQAYVDDAIEAMGEKRWEDVFTKCFHAVTGYLAEKLNVPAGSLTPREVESALSSRGLPQDFVAETIRFLEGCDYGRFASSRESSAVVGKYVESAQKIIRYLEREGVMNR